MIKSQGAFWIFVVFVIVILAVFCVAWGIAFNMNVPSYTTAFEQIIEPNNFDESLEKQNTEEIKNVREKVYPEPIPGPIPQPEPTAPISDEVPLEWGLQQAVVDNCEEYGLDVAVVLGIMEVESDFRLQCDNGVCYGVMQIHRGNSGWVQKNAGVDDIFDPEQNIRAGCWILSRGLELHGDIEKALVWYNAGEVYSSSTPYSRKVLECAQTWTGIIENEFA